MKNTVLDRLTLEMGDRLRRLKILDSKAEFLLHVQNLGGLSSATLKDKCDNLATFYDAGTHLVGELGSAASAFFVGNLMCVPY